MPAVEQLALQDTNPAPGLSSASWGNLARPRGAPGAARDPLSLGRQADSVVDGGGQAAAELRIERAKSLRRERFELLHLVQSISTRRRVIGCCRNKIHKGAEVELIRHNGVAHFAGLQRCASVWNCPVCAGKISAVRRAEVERIGQLHVERHAKLDRKGAPVLDAHGHPAMVAGSIAWLTLTTSHHVDTDELQLRRAVAAAWREVQQDSAYRRCKQELELVGTLRAFEVTYGQNGFHPHIHVALFFDRDLQPLIIPEQTSQHWITDDADGSRILESETREPAQRLTNPELVAFADVIYRAWSAAIVAKGMPSPSRERGVDLQLMRPGSRAWAKYLTKLGFEFAAPQYKQGRQESRSMWEVARDAAEQQLAMRALDMPTEPRVWTVDENKQAVLGYVTTEGEVIAHRWQGCAQSYIADVMVWRRYERMMFGARQLEWSRGMRKRYQVDEQTDLELVTATEKGELVAAFPAPVWKKVRRKGPGGLAALIEAASEGPVSLWLELSSWGINIRAREIRWGPGVPTETEPQQRQRGPGP